MDVRLPDGTIIRGVPDDMSRADLTAKLKANGYTFGDEPKAPKVTEGMGRADRVLAGAGKTLTDAGLGIKQRWDEAAAGLERLVTGGRGQDAAGILARTNQTVADKKATDAAIASDPYGIAGSVFMGTALAAPLAPAGIAGAGAAMGYVQPTTDGLGEVAKNTALGAGLSVLGDKLVKGAAAVIRPKADPNVQALMNEGVRPTIGQAIGGSVAKAEERAMSLPIVGDAIAAARARAGGELNTAAANRALRPIGEAAPKGLTGRDAVEHVRKTLGDKYDAILPQLTVRADAQFASEVSTLRTMVKTGSIDPKAAKAFERILNDDVLSKFKGQNVLTGQTMKGIESDLGARASQLAQSTDADARLVADALREVQSALRGMVQRSNPAKAAELKAINEGWANFKRLERAAAALGADEGVFSAAQLQNAVKALDKSKDKARFAGGNALMQDLSEPAKAVLGAKVPNSGTADRLMNAGALASGLVEPVVPLSLLAGAGVYSQPVQNALLHALMTRPAGASALANQVRRAGPVVNAISAGSVPWLAQ